MTAALYLIMGAGLIWSLAKSREKTLLALRKALKSLNHILPQLLAILLLIGMMLAVLTPEQIMGLMGSESGVWGVLLAAAVGSITLIPAFVAFPLAAALLQSGAGLVQIAAFVSTLMMVGVITLPLEVRHFGRRAAITRNVLALGFSLVVAVVMGAVL